MHTLGQFIQDDVFCTGQTIKIPFVINEFHEDKTPFFLLLGKEFLGHDWGMYGTLFVGEVRQSSSILIFLKTNKPLFHALLDDLSRFLKF